MSALLALAPAVPLLAGAALLVLPVGARARVVVTVAATAVVLAGGVWLVAATRDGEVLATTVAGWVAGIGITFAADLFAALMLTLAALLVLVCVAFAAAVGEFDRRPFASLVLVLSAGVYGAVLTADLFNLFVMVEVLLVPSYVLLVLRGSSDARDAGRVYVSVNLLASTVLLAGVGLVYGVTGTVNLGQLAGAARSSPAAAAAGAVVLTALAVKAALVPLHGWLPRSYPHASPAVTALFSGLLTKVGVYAMFRVYAVVYDGDPRFLWILLVVTTVTMVIGVLGAVGEQGTREILSFHMVSQIGYILLGLALFGLAGIAAGIFYLVQYSLVKASLFLSLGAVETAYGTGRLDRLGGLVRREPLVALAFLLAALSLAGIPPFSGFVAKLVLVQAAFAERAWAAGAVAVAVSLLTLLSMVKIWNGVFWGRPVEGADGTGEARLRRIGGALYAPALLLAVGSLVLGVGAEGLLALSERAAAGLVDPAAYVSAVTGR